MQDRYSENNDPIEELFRKGFESHEERPPEEVWNNIANFLDANEKGTVEGNSFFKQHWGKVFSGITLVSCIVLLYTTNKKERSSTSIEKEKGDSSLMNTISPSIPAVPKGHPVEVKDENSSTEEERQSSPVIQVPDSSKVEVQKDEKKEQIIIEPKKEMDSASYEKNEVQEEEPNTLYDQLKKENKGGKKLFIEKEK